MNDRLAELTGGSSAPSNPFAPAAPAADPSNVDVELGGGGGGGDGGGSAGGDGFMQGFFDQANEVKADIDAIKDACKEMAALSESAVMATGREEVAAKERLNAIITNTNKRVAHAKGQLQAMREETARLKTGGRNVKPAEIRVRENLQTTLTKKFVDLAKDYQGEQNRWKAQVRGKAERAVRAVKPEATEEELDAVFEQNDGVKRVLEAAVLQQSGDPVQVANVLQEVQDTYEDVRRLEASILELHKMFMDLALLVEQQGEMLDQIEFQVKSAGDYVKTGNEQIEQAIEKAKTIRKRQCCIIAIVLIILAVIVVVVIIATS